MKGKVAPWLIGVVACLALAVLVGSLAIPGTALADPPTGGKHNHDKGDDDGGGGGGGGGIADMCFTFADVFSGEGLFHDGTAEYCDNNQEKLVAEMDTAGHVRLRPDNSKNQTGRKLFALVDFVGPPCDPADAWTTEATEGLGCGGVGEPTCEVSQLTVARFRHDFDMRQMIIGEERTDINLNIAVTGHRIQFDPIATDGGGDRPDGINRFGLDTSCTTFCTVRRLAVDEWEIENVDASGELSKGLLHTFNDDPDVEKWQSKGIVTVPHFTATVRFK